MRNLIMISVLLLSGVASAQEKSHTINILQMDYPGDFDALMALAYPILKNGEHEKTIQSFPDNRYPVQIEYEKFQVNEYTTCLKGIREIGLNITNPFAVDHSEFAGVCSIEVIRKP